MPDALVEIWQAGRAYGERTDGFEVGSQRHDADGGRFEFVTVKPGRPWPARAAGAAPRGRRVRARAAQAGRDADVLPGRGRGERGRSGARPALDRRAAGDARRARRGRRAPRSTSGCRATARRRSSRCDAFAAPLRPGGARARRCPDRAWLEAMLDAERALANARGARGRVPAHRRARSPRRCRRELLRRARRSLAAGRAVGNPAEPLVRALRAGRRRRGGRLRPSRGDEPGHPRHRGDARRAAGARADRGDLDGAARRARRSPGSTARRRWRRARCSSRRCRRPSASRRRAGSSRARRRARGSPISAPRLCGAARRRGRHARRARRATASTSPRLFARELELASRRSRGTRPRSRIAELGARSRRPPGVCAKIGLDVVLLAQTEVGEVREAAGGRLLDDAAQAEPGRRRRSRSPARGARAAHAGVLDRGLVQEHERAARRLAGGVGGALGALAYAGGAAAAVARGARGRSRSTRRGCAEPRADGRRW